MNETTKPKRRWLSFGLKSLMFVTLLIAIALGCFSWQLSEGRRHEDLAKQLDDLGCRVQFTHIELVAVTNPSPAQLSPFGGIPMEYQSTISPWIEDLALAHAYRRIESITFYNSQHQNKILKSFALAKEIDQCEILSFYAVKVDQKELLSLVKSVKAEKLYLSQVDLPRTEMPWLNQDQLTWLCVKRTQFSDPALDSLPLSLEYFDATRTRISDKGLASLIRLKNLGTLKLPRTPTSKSAIEDLRKQMPWCKITWRPLENP